MYTVMFGHKKAQDKRTAKSGVLNLHFYMITPFTTAFTATYFFYNLITFFLVLHNFFHVDISNAGVWYLCNWSCSNYIIKLVSFKHFLFFKKWILFTLFHAKPQSLDSTWEKGNSCSNELQNYNSIWQRDGFYFLWLERLAFKRSVVCLWRSSTAS